MKYNGVKDRFLGELNLAKLSELAKHREFLANRRLISIIVIVYGFSLLYD